MDTRIDLTKYTPTMIDSNLYYVVIDGDIIYVDKEGNIQLVDGEVSLPHYVEIQDTDEDLFKEILDKMYSTFVAKNHDYGNSVQSTYDLFGDISFLTRINDKINRLNTLCTKGNAQVKDESINDTILDLANYAVLFLLTRNK